MVTANLTTREGQRNSARARRISFETLKAFLARVPAVQQPIDVGELDGGGWYAKFGLDIHHKWRGMLFRNLVTF
jgi:hypothetical protein